MDLVSSVEVYIDNRNQQLATGQMRKKFHVRAELECEDVPEEKKKTESRQGPESPSAVIRRHRS